MVYKVIYHIKVSVKPYDLSSIPVTHMVGEENQLLENVPWPPYVHTYTHDSRAGEMTQCLKAATSLAETWAQCPAPVSGVSHLLPCNSRSRRPDTLLSLSQALTCTCAYPLQTHTYT